MEEIDANTVEQWLDRMADEIRVTLGTEGVADLQIVGVHTGGVRVARVLHERLAPNATLGTLDISFYRDDFTRSGLHPQVRRSELPLSVDDRTILLVDDVLYSGRTVRAALNELFDYGRPERVLLSVLIERTGRELPIRADFVGEQMNLAPDEQVRLHRNDLGLEVRKRAGARSSYG